MILSFCLVSCIHIEKTKQNEVKVRSDHFPQSLNYLINGSYHAHDIQRKTFNELLFLDGRAKFKPLLAIGLPEVIELDTGYLFKFTLRDEAKWDNGAPITSQDIGFSLKAYKLPLKENVGISSYYSRIKDVICNEDNIKVFQLLTKGNKHDLLRLTGDFGILEKAKFDPEGLLDHIRLSDFDLIPEEIANDEKVISFFKTFTKDNYKHNDAFFSSSGSYKISHLEQGKSITLTKNKNWWGNSMVNVDYINANPDRITYYSIPETITAIYALKNGDIDVMDDIPSNEFIQLEKDEGFKKRYNLFSPLKYTFTYIGFNSEARYLNDKKIRHALVHLIDKTKIVESVESGYGQPTIGPINPAKKFYYNDKIVPYKYDSSKCFELLTQSGLKKVNNHWYQEGEEKPVEFTLIHKQNSVYENIAQIFVSEAQKAGIKISAISYDDRTVRKMVKDRNFDITIGAFNGSPFSYNFSGLFSTDAARSGGMNFTGFGNAKSDSLIQAINYAEDSVQRRNSLFEFQKILHDESTMVFLYFAKNKIAISKKFTNLNISSLKPGYDVTSFKLAREID
ncbi:ABC transporter substrate-binding protein [Reichenbachiella sp. MALMAid0571]|uniref:ABC transporter substrate-binding protein n=1 Tax=Reichenbachiella sp. MALMAid0571 TaxID=3143939 RepID=UPI0032DF58A5